MSKINNIPGNNDTIVTLTYEDHHEGWDSIAQTGTAEQLAYILTNYSLQAKTPWGENNALDVMRDQDLLEDYERGDEDFTGYVTEKIKENFMELDSLIECSIEQYDHKRGKCTVSSELVVTLGNLKESPHSASGWTASVDHNDGTFSVDL